MAGRLDIAIAQAKVMKSDLKSKVWRSKPCFPHGHGQVERRLDSSLLGSRTGVLTASQM